MKKYRFYKEKDDLGSLTYQNGQAQNLICKWWPVVNNKYKFKRTIIVKELNAKGKPNTEFDNFIFEEAKIKKGTQVNLFK